MNSEERKTVSQQMTLGNWLTLIGMLITIAMSVFGSFAMTQSRIAAMQAEQAALRRDYNVMWAELQNKADEEDIQRDLQDVKEGVRRLEEIMMILGGNELKKKLND